METIYKLEDFVVNHMFRPYMYDFINDEGSKFEIESMRLAMESKFRKEPELIIELLEDMPETKKKVFRRIKAFGGVKFYKYLNMENELIKYIKQNLGMEK